MVRERAFDLALLRTYGASNFQLIRIVAYEGFLLTGIALIAGALLSQVGLYVAFSAFKSGYHQDILVQLPYAQMTQTGILIFALIALTLVLAILPLLNMNVSKILSHEN